MSTLIQRRDGNVRWQALADWEPLLFGPQGPHLDSRCEHARVRVVKHGSHRTVYRIELPDRAFYVKQYRRGRLLAGLGHLVRRSASRREWHQAAEIARRGVPTIRPVAWAEEVRGGLVRDHYLVTEAIQPASTLEQYLLDQLPRLAPDAQRTMRRKILASLARFVAAIHQAGIFHNDFHVGNVLVRLDTLELDAARADRPPELHLIDVPGVRFSGPLKWPASRRSLVMLNAAWRERTRRSDRLRFWRIYLAERPELELPEERAAVAQLERASRDYSRRVARRRDKRALRTNRDFAALGGPLGEAHGVADLSRTELSRLLEDPEELLRRNLHRPVKLSRTKWIVRAELPLDDRPVRVAYQRYRPRNRWKAFWGIFRRSRALRGWRLGHALLLRGIATARPLAVCDVRRPWHRRQSYLATEWIDGAENLHQYGWRLAGENPPQRLRRAARCAESLGRLIGRMHAWGITHGDLKAANLLVVERGEDIQTYLIDAEDVRIARRLTLRRRARDLARLATSITAHPWVSQTILRRFLRSYVRQFPPGSIAWKPLWREVARRSRRLIRRKHRRGQEVL